MNGGDLDALCAIMCDGEAMHAAYGAPFTPEQAQAWLGRHRKRYRELGFGLWAVVLKETGAMIGQCGLTLQPWEDGQVLELGYLFAKEHWHRGYAIEAVQACRDYAFSALNTDSVCSIIRDTHLASRRVAERCGMRAVGQAVKVFRDMEMNFVYTGQRIPAQQNRKTAVSRQRRGCCLPQFFVPPAQPKGLDRMGRMWFTVCII